MGMREYLTSTQSICRECRKPLSAQLFVQDAGVWLEKRCPEHGLQRARVYGDAQAYLNLGHFHRRASVPLSFATAAAGCPDSCGLCPEHEQHVCLPIIEITDHCNWQCPICLVCNPASYHRTRQEVARILDGLIRSEGQIDVLNLSGGEPTLNPNFRGIVEECVGRKEVLRVSVSTNGSVLVRDNDLLRFLGAQRVIVSLQFDGMDDEVYTALRGRAALEEKLRLIDLCGEANVPMSLTATVAAGINDRRISQVADLVFRHDHILSAMFQPAAYAGSAARFCTLHASGGREQRPSAPPSPPLEERVGERRPVTLLDAAACAEVLGGPANASHVPAESNHLLSLPLSSRGGEGTAVVVAERRDAYVEQTRLGRPEGAVTISEVMAALHGAGSGTVSAEDFSPLPCSHPACFALAFYLKIEDNRYVPIKQMVNADRYMRLIQNRALFGTDAESFQLITDAVYDLWSGSAALSPDSQKVLNAVRQLIAATTAGGGYSARRALSVAERSVKSVFIHQFMDPDTFDLSRARKCCQVYPQLDGRMIPACVHNCLNRGRQV